MSSIRLFFTCMRDIILHLPNTLPLAISFPRKVKQIKYFIDFFPYNCYGYIWANIWPYGHVYTTYVKYKSYIYMCAEHICSQEREIVSSL